MSSSDSIFFSGPLRYLVKTIAIIEVMIVIIFILTELGNVASNFWITNVFTGTWCGLVLFIHALTLFLIGEFFTKHQLNECTFYRMLSTWSNSRLSCSDHYNHRSSRLCTAHFIQWCLHRSFIDMHPNFIMQ